MAEVTAFRNNALPYPVYGVPFTIVFPLLDADGDPVTGATCDSEVSLNGDTGADCTNEGTEITYTTATNKGMYYLALTGAEMTADIVTVTIYSATSKATCIVLYPRKLVQLVSGTSQGGAAGYITLAAGTVLFNGQYNGCLCVATIDGNVEARVLQACTASNQQCTVTPGWNVAPDADDTYILYLPEGRQIPEANVRAVSDDSTAADNLELMFDGTGYAGGTAKLGVNAAQVGGQTANAAGAVTFPASIGTSTYAGADTAGTTTLLGIFLGITSLPKWLRGLFRKDAMDATAKSEVNTGSGTFDETTDSNEAIRDTAPLGTAMRGTDSAALASDWTSGRAGKLDNIPAGTMPTQAEVLAIQNTTRSKSVIPGTIERPDTGSTAYKLSLYLYDDAGNMEAPDALPTVTAANQAGTDRSANLGTVTLLSTGAYEVTYTLASDAAIEQLLFVWTYLEGGNTLKVPASTQVVDTTAVDFTAADRQKLDNLDAVKPAYTPLVNSSGYVTAANASFQANNLPADYLSSGEQAALTAASTGSWYAAPTIPTPPTKEAIAGAVLDEAKGIHAGLLAGVALEGTLTAIKGTGWTTETLKAINDLAAIKVGMKLATDGLDAVVAEIGTAGKANLNARQALAILLASAVGDITGAASNTPVFKGANASTTRITAAVSADGRTITLSLPT